MYILYMYVYVRCAASRHSSELCRVEMESASMALKFLQRTVQ